MLLQRHDLGKLGNSGANLVYVVMQNKKIIGLCEDHFIKCILLLCISTMDLPFFLSMRILITDLEKPSDN